MGICGRNRRPEKQVQEHKWIYVNLADFKSTSWWNYVAYVGIFLGIIISIACYAADIYTAVILIAFGRWTNKIEQQELIDFEIARFIFCACIFVSFALLIVDWYFAIRDIRSDGVAEAYLNVIAVRWNCIRGGKSKGDTGWKRFLVFSKLTSSRGFVDYIALFIYFAFKGWLRIFLAEGPRVVINTLTFISVFRLGDLVAGHADGYWDKFWETVQTLYKEDQSQVFVLATMAFTTVMWAFAVLRVLISAVLYICFLWHAMGNGVGLRGYCKERIDARMRVIVQKKSEKALAEERKQRGSFLRQPTLPVLPAADGPFSSTEKLVPRRPTGTPPESILQHPAAHPLDFTREDLERGPATPVAAVRPPPPARTITDQFMPAHYHPPPPRTPAPEQYQMHALPRPHAAAPHTPFPADRIPRNTTPPDAAPQTPDPFHRADSESPYVSDYSYAPTPPPRSLTAQPPARNPRPAPAPLDFAGEDPRYGLGTPTFGPAVRSNTAGLEHAAPFSACELPRSHTAHPPSGYDSPVAEHDYRSGYPAPDYPRSHTAHPVADSPYHPAGVDFTSAYPAPDYPRSHTAHPAAAPDHRSAPPPRPGTAPLHRGPSAPPAQPYTPRGYVPARYHPPREGWEGAHGQAM